MTELERSLDRLEVQGTPPAISYETVKIIWVLAELRDQLPRHLDA
jgi:hypothetical protein